MAGDLVQAVACDVEDVASLKTALGDATLLVSCIGASGALSEPPQMMIPIGTSTDLSDRLLIEHEPRASVAIYLGKILNAGPQQRSPTSSS